MSMEFFETTIFTKRITDWPDELYRQLQYELMQNPKAGDVIKGSGGLRKIRWKAPGVGKRGGLRIIYYCINDDHIFMIFAFKKNETEDLTEDQVKKLKRVVDQYKN